MSDEKQVLLEVELLGDPAKFAGMQRSVDRDTTTITALRLARESKGFSLRETARRSELSAAHRP